MFLQVPRIVVQSNNNDMMNAAASKVRTFSVRFLNTDGRVKEAQVRGWQAQWQCRTRRYPPLGVSMTTVRQNRCREKSGT